MYDELGDRMKEYESLTESRLMPLLPTLARVDGRSFHTFTRGMERPYDPRMAQAMIAHMSILFAHARLIGWRIDNPCAGLRLVTPPPRDRQASWAEVDALLSAAERLGQPGLALAIRLALYQGQRQTDVRMARRGDFALIPVMWPGISEPRPGWVWSLRQSKRGRRVQMQVHAECIPGLRLALADTGSADAPLGADAALIRDGATGQELSEDLFSRRFAAIRAEAARALPSVAGLQFRDLRRTFAMLARQAGITDADVADTLGNTAARSNLLRQTYMPAQLTTTSRAIAAVQRPKGD
jgi:integrase